MWISNVPASCDLCQKPISLVFIDGATKMGPWAIMCPKCHELRGCGLGTGRDQKYVFDRKDWVKE